MNTEVLEKIGLSKNEIRVYFALLELDQATATPIVKKSGIPNSKVYPTLEKLIGKGLVSYVVKNNVRHFQTSDPRNLIELMNEREKEIKEQKKEIQKIVPDIRAKREVLEDKQEAIVFESFEGIKSAFNLILNILKKNEEYYVFTLGEKLREKRIINFFQNYHKKRIERGIKVRLVSGKGTKPIIKEYHEYRNMKVRYTDQKLPVGTFIFRGYVMTVVWGEKPTAFVIKSRKNYEHYREFFEEIWKKAKT